VHGDGFTGIDGVADAFRVSVEACIFGRTSLMLSWVMAVDFLSFGVG